MRKRIWAVLLTVCLLAGLLPTTALATPATMDIYSYKELLAAEENSYTGIIIHGDAFNETWPEDATTAALQYVGSVYVTGNWVIPENVTLNNYRAISLEEDSTVTVNGTWSNHGTGSGISGGTVVVNGTFVTGNGDDENVVVNSGGVLDLSSFYETFGNLTLEEGAEVQGDVMFYLYGTLTAHGQTLQNKICVTKAGAQAALAGEMTVGEIRVGTSLPVSSASLTVAKGSTVSAGLVWCIEGSLTVAGQLDCENLYCSMNSTLVSASRIQVDGGLTVAQQVVFVGPVGGTIDLGSTGVLAIKGSDVSAAGSYGIFDDDNTGHITGSGTVKLYDIPSEDSMYIPELFGYDSDTFVENRDLLTDEIAETVTIWHSWTHTWDEGEETKAPTCTEPGEITYTCTDCGATKTKVIPATGHTYGEDGVCTVCGASKADTDTETYSITLYYDESLCKVEAINYSTKEVITTGNGQTGTTAEGTWLLFQITDIQDGYRIGAVTLNDADRTGSFVNGAYGGLAISNISTDYTLAAVMEEVPDTLPSVTSVTLYTDSAGTQLAAENIAYTSESTEARLYGKATFNDGVEYPAYYAMGQWQYSLDGETWNDAASWGSNRFDFWPGWGYHQELDFLNASYDIRLKVEPQDLYTTGDPAYSNVIHINGGAGADPTDPTDPEDPAGDVVLYVGGVDMVKGGTVDGAVYDAATNTLTLTDAVILGCHTASGIGDNVSAVRAGIYYKGSTPLKVVLTGDSTIVLYPSRDGDAEYGSYIAAVGIYADGSVDVESTNNGSLIFGSGMITEDDAIFETKEQEAYVYAQPIHVTDSLTVGGSADVNGRISSFEIDPPATLYEVEYSSASNAAPVQVYAGDTLHVTGTAAFRAGSAQADGMTLVDSGTAQITTLKGGSVQVEAGDLTSGTAAADDITVSGGTVTINSLTAAGDVALSGGTLTTNQLSTADLNVTGGSLTAEASSSNTSLKGIIELSGDANISGGTVTATGGIQSAYVTGSYVSTTGSLFLSGNGAVTAHGNGVRFGGVVSVSGDAELTVTDVTSSAITGYQGVTIADNAVVTADGPFAGIQVGSYNSTGVFRMTGGTLAASATSTDDNYPCNMALYVMTGSVEFSGGHAELTGDPGCGIFFAAADEADLGDFSVTGGYLKVSGARGGVIWQGGSGLPAVTRTVTVKTNPAEIQYLDGSLDYTSSGYDFTAYAATYVSSDVTELDIDPDLNGWPTNGLTTIIFGVEPCTEHTWGEDGICIICGAVKDSDTPDSSVVLYVDGVDMANGGKVTGAVYDAASNTLTLNGAAITQYYTIPLTDSAADPRAGIYYQGEETLNIVVSGGSTISVVPGVVTGTYSSTAVPAFGIYADGSVKVQLDSYLNIQPGTADGAESDEKANTGAKVLGGAVYVTGDMTVAGSSFLRYLNFGTFQYSSTSGVQTANNHQMPFQVDGNLSVANGPTLRGGEMKVGGNASIAGKLDLTAAVGGYQKDSGSFVYCADATLEVGGTLDITANSVTIGSGCTRSGYAGLKAGSLRQSGGTLTVTNDEGNYYSIQCDDLLQTGGTLTANRVVEAGSSAYLSGGALTAAALTGTAITVDGTANVNLSGTMGGLGANITISGGTVNITGLSFGIQTANLTVTGGTTTVTAPVALSFSDILKRNGGNFTVTGGTLKLTAEGDYYGSTIAIRWDDVSCQATADTHFEPYVTVPVTPSDAKFLETVNDVGLYAATYVAGDVTEVIIDGGYASNGLTAITFGAEPCTEHDWGDWVETQAPTCTGEGVETRTCTVCGETETRETDALGHDYAAVVTAPTCTEQGYTTYTCSRCGDSYVDDYTDAQGHDYVAVVTAPTCTEQGYTTYTCSRCGDSYVDTYVDALGHDWGEWIVDKEATGTEDGFRHRDCSRCDAVDTQTISMLPKQEVSWLLDQITWTYGGRTDVTNTAYNDTEDGGTLTYSSSDKSVATVDADGKATIVGTGTTTITVTAAAVPGQYAETSASYTLVINKASLTVTANDHTITYGQAPANSGWTASGFAYGDDASAVTGTAGYTYTYAQYGNTGAYEISVSGLSAKNYDITFAPGTLTVSKATDYIITLDNLAQRDDDIAAVTASITPQDTTAQINVEYQVDGAWITSLPTAAGEYQARASLTSSGNIQTDGAYTYGILTIQRSIVVDDTDVSVTVDGGKAELIVTEDELADIVDNADGEVSVNLGGVEGVDELVLPGSLLEALSESDKADSLTITTEDASISMSGAVLDTVASAITGEDTVAVKLAAVEKKALNEDQQAALDSITQDAVIVEVSLIITHADGTETELHQLGGSVEVTVPYEDDVPEGKYIVVCYLPDDGNVTYVRGTYDAETKQVTFTTNHFSNYAVFVSGDPAVVVDGGSGSGLYAEGATVTIHADSKSGYTFAGWEVMSGGVTLTNAKAVETTFVMPAANVELRATYTKITSGGGGGGGVSAYTLTFDTNGGSKIDSVSKASGATIDLTEYVPTRTGYDFEGWYSDAKLIGKITSVKLTKDMTVYAKWTEKGGENPFADVADDAYYADAVIWTVGEGITSGTTATTFTPNAPCTRAQAVTFLWRAAGSPEPESMSSFADVPADSYYAKAVAWAVEQGVTKGTSDTAFSPNATCTRAQIVTFLWRSQKSPASDSVNPFTDVAADAYYTGAVLWAVENGVTSGTTANTFSPANDCTRAQIVTFLYRAFAN